MAASVGTAALVLSVNSTALTKGLDETSKTVKSWAARTQTAVAEAGKRGASAAAGAVSGGASSLLGMAKGGLAGAALGIGMGGASGVVSGVKDLAGQGRSAKALGIDSAQFMGMSKQMAALGVEGEGVQKVFGHLGKAAIEASEGNHQLAAEFSKLGLTGKELTGLSLDQQFLKVSTAIGQLPNSAQQAQMAMSLFGKQGMALLPMIEKGGPAIQKGIDKAKMFGTALSQVDMDKILRAQQSLPKLGMVFDGLKNKLLVSMSPVIEVISTKLSSAMERIAPALDWIGRAISKHWSIAAEVIGGVINLVVEGVSAFGDWIGEMMGFESASTSIEKVVTDVWYTVAKAISYVWDVLKAGAGVFAYIGSYVLKFYSWVVDTFKDTIKSLFEIASKLPDSLGGEWFGKQAKNIDGLSKRMDIAADKMRNWAKDSIMGIGNSSNEVDAFFNRIQTKKQEEIETKKLVGEIKKSNAYEYKGAAAAIMGSKEAYTNEVRFASMGTGMQIDKAAQQLGEAKRTNTLLDRMIAILKQPKLELKTV